MTIPACKLTLNLVPSRQLTQLVVAGHVLAAASLLLLDISGYWRLGGWLLIALHGLYAWWDSRWLRGLRQVGVSISEGRWELVRLDGRVIQAEGTGYFVAPWLVILKFSVDGRARLLPLFKDSCNPEDLRRLRVVLRVRSF